MEYSESRERRKILQGHVAHSTKWVLLSTLVLQFIYAHYFIQDNWEMDRGLLLWNLAQLMALCLGLGCGLAGIRSRRLGWVWWACGVGVGLCWTLSAHNAIHNWNQFHAAGKLLTLGMFAVIIGWYSHLPLLLCALVPILYGLVHIHILHDARDGLDTTISLVKFPFLVLMSLYTLRKWFKFGVDTYLESLELNQRLEEMSRVDELTRVKNRRGFNEAFSHGVNLARRLNQPLTLVLMDIDFFKQYNDSLGHPAGDDCLKKVAWTVSGQIRRAVDLFARVGGEEFALVLPGTTPDQAVELVNHIRHALDRTDISHPDSRVSDRVTLSMGIAGLERGEDEQALYERADQALYQAKTGGRNRYQIHGD
ncbi:MAG: membrane-associated sensor domain-containing protein [Desulfobacterales bacterium]|nr:membrane-associated sensor domain-containing protein [Desulfobacterales bacterium]